MSDNQTHPTLIKMYFYSEPLLGHFHFREAKKVTRNGFPDYKNLFSEEKLSKYIGNMYHFPGGEIVGTMFNATFKSSVPTVTVFLACSVNVAPVPSK